MNIFQVKEYNPLIKEEWKNKLYIFPLGKAFEQQTKKIEDQGIKHVETLKFLKLENV